MIKKDDITQTFKDIQDHICTGLSEVSGQEYHEDNWEYTDGDGGGRTRIFAGDTIEKGGSLIHHSPLKKHTHFVDFKICVIKSKIWYNEFL